MRAAQTFQNKPTVHARGNMKLGDSPAATLSQWGQADPIGFFYV